MNHAEQHNQEQRRTRRKYPEPMPRVWKTRRRRRLADQLDQWEAEHQERKNQDNGPGLLMTLALIPFALLGLLILFGFGMFLGLWLVTMT